MTSLPAPGAPPLSVRNGRVKAARRLVRRPARVERRQFLAEGAKALAEALQLPDVVVEVFATVAAGREHADLRRSAEDAGVPWYDVTDEAVAALAGSVTPQGVVAVCRFLDQPLDELLARAPGPDVGGSRTRQLVVCADVRDPGNAGTIIRTADAVGAAGVVLAGSSVDPYNDKTVRATVGSLFHLPVVTGGDPAAVVAALREDGWTVLAADGAGETDLFDLTRGDDLPARVAWLFGNEAWGLPAGLAALADHRVAIPIPGRAESLNLSTAAAICLYAAYAG